MKPLQTWRGRLQAVALAVAAIALVAVANVAARQDAPGRPPGRGMRQPLPFAQLNLSADQKTRVQGIFEKHREAEQATREQLQTAHESLRAAIYGSATPDAGQIEDLTNQIAQLEGQALRARIATEVEVASVLTDEQRHKMASMRPPGPPRGPRE
jgi:Spy/CpxP family protein refolding chaperone